MTESPPWLTPIAEGRGVMDGESLDAAWANRLPGWPLWII